MRQYPKGNLVREWGDREQRRKCSARIWLSTILITILRSIKHTPLEERGWHHVVPVHQSWAMGQTEGCHLLDEVVPIN